MGCHALLQGIFLTQGWNPGLLHCRQILYHLSYKGSPWDNSTYTHTQKTTQSPFFRLCFQEAVRTPAQRDTLLGFGLKGITSHIHPSPYKLSFLGVGGVSDMATTTYLYLKSLHLFSTSHSQTFPILDRQSPGTISFVNLYMMTYANLEPRSVSSQLLSFGVSVEGSVFISVTH